MAWRRIGDQPLSEPMLTRFTGIYAAQGEDESNWRNGWVTRTLILTPKLVPFRMMVAVRNWGSPDFGFLSNIRTTAERNTYKYI